MVALRSVGLVGALVVQLACSGEEWAPQMPPALRPVVAARQAVGCYQATSVDRSLRYVPPSEPPRTFYLTDELATVFTWEGRTVAAYRVRQPASYPPEGRWELTTLDAVDVWWTNGMSGVRLKARRSSTAATWYGRAEPFSDIGPNMGVPVWSAAVTLRRVADTACNWSRP